MNISDLGRLFRTARYLRSEQIFGRLVFRLTKPKPNLSAAPEIRDTSGTWIAPAERDQSLFGPTEFTLLGARYNVDLTGWDADDIAKLTRYNFHYFDDLNADDAISRAEWHEALIDRWITENQPARGSGWEPYPLSMRIVNWIKWLQLTKVDVSTKVIASLATQIRYLNQRIEWHLLGNHLLVNAKALIFAGLFFEGKEADSWVRKGLRILNRELPEQILPDGGQFELSPMYHALAIEDLLDLLNISQRYVQDIPSDALKQLDRCRAFLPQMFDWLQTMSHPDGGIAFFNDAAFGIAPEFDELRTYARKLDIDVSEPAIFCLHALPNSGYCRLANRDVVAILDLAAVGPNYLPGHAHADTLSFEMSLKGQRLIVNGGTSVYGTGIERHRQRGTRAHSTLCINSEDSSEVWAGFRVGRRAQVSNIRNFETAQSSMAGAIHHGYTHLSGSPVHQRDWELEESKLTITDKVTGQLSQNIEINFHLAPSIEIISDRHQGIQLLDHNGKTIAHVLTSHPAGFQIIPSSWHPRFGVSISTQSIRISLNGVLPISIQTIFDWSGR